MKSLLQGTLLLALWLSPVAFAQDAGNSKSLRILCYNDHWCLGMDGKYDVERIADVIKSVKPDLVALQEVDVGVLRCGRVLQAQLLGELTGMAARMGPTQHYEGGLFGNAVLTDRPILDVEIVPLPYTEATPELITYPRGAIAVTIAGPDGKPLRFISTHFQHSKFREDRVAEAKAINALFAKEGDDVPTILAGDMNAKPGEEPVQLLLKHWTNATDDPPTGPPHSPAPFDARRVSGAAR